MTIAVQGLGKMGMQIARKLSDHGHHVVAINRSHDKVMQAVAFGAEAADTKQAAVKAFGEEKVVIWIMLPAEVVDGEVDEWLKLMPSGSIIIDGGNSDYRLTTRLNQVVIKAGVNLVDVGTSGGVWGLKNGFSMMVGADDKTSFEYIEPLLKVLAAPRGGYHYFGKSGSGHFVKMTHNAIEYGMMESLAEGYRVLKQGPYPDLDLAAAGDVWQHSSVITSWLNELARDTLTENPNLDGIDGYVAESGEARWTLETAEANRLSLPSIKAAFDVRLASQTGDVSFATKLLAAMRNKFGGHDLNK